MTETLTAPPQVEVLASGSKRSYGWELARAFLTEEEQWGRPLPPHYRYSLSLIPDNAASSSFAPLFILQVDEALHDALPRTMAGLPAAVEDLLARLPEEGEAPLVRKENSNRDHTLYEVKEEELLILWRDYSFLEEEEEWTPLERLLLLCLSSRAEATTVLKKRSQWWDPQLPLLLPSRVHSLLREEVRPTAPDLLTAWTGGLLRLPQEMKEVEELLETTYELFHPPLFLLFYYIFGTNDFQQACYDLLLVAGRLQQVLGVTSDNNSFLFCDEPPEDTPFKDLLMHFTPAKKDLLYLPWHPGLYPATETFRDSLKQLTPHGQETFLSMIGQNWLGRHFGGWTPKGVYWEEYKWWLAHSFPMSEQELHKFLLWWLTPPFESQLTTMESTAQLFLPRIEELPHLALLLKGLCESFLGELPPEGEGGLSEGELALKLEEVLPPFDERLSFLSLFLPPNCFDDAAVASIDEAEVLLLDKHWERCDDYCSQYLQNTAYPVSQALATYTPQGLYSFITQWRVNTQEEELCPNGEQLLWMTTHLTEVTAYPFNWWYPLMEADLSDILTVVA